MMTEIEKLNNEGVQLFLNKHFKEARKKYQEALKLNSKYATTLNNLGMCYLQERNFSKAEQCFLDAISVKESSTYFLNLGHALANQGKFNEAEENYIKSIEIEPNSLTAHKSLGTLYQKQQRFSESIEVWETIISDVNNDPIFKIELAKDFIQLKEYQNALDVLLEAEQYEKDRAVTWYYMALIHFHQKNFGLAEKKIKLSLGEEPENLSFRALLAVIYLSLSDLQKAVKQWDYILSVDVNNEKIRIDKAVALLSYGFKNEALKTLNEILQRDPKNEKALFYKSLTQIEINKKDPSAIDTLKAISQGNTEFSKRANEILQAL